MFPHGFPSNDDNIRDENKENLPPSDIPFKKTTLLPENVPGAVLKQSIEKSSVLQLKRFLQCRGVKISNKTKKQELIAQVEKNREKPIVSNIDGGVWSLQKEKAARAVDLNATTSCDIVFPTTTWKDFPSQNIPELFSFGAIYHYLMDSCSVGDDALTGFDTAKPFNKGRILFRSGFVTNIKDAVTAQNQHYCVKSDIYASMRCELHIVLVMLDKSSGKILDASCDCKASTLARCSHVAALLFAVEDYLLTFGNAPPACTSQVCAWNQPKKSKDPTEIMKRQYTNKRNCKKMYNFKPDPTPCAQQSTTNNNKLLQLCEQFEAPTMWELLLEYIYEDYKLSDSQKLILQQNVDSLRQALTFDLQEAGPLPGTEDQANSSLWFARRKFLITASCCKNFTNINKHNVFSKLKAHLYSSPFHSIYTQYGKDHEKHAVADYLKESKNYVKSTGLWINPRYPGLGASPDGLVFDYKSKTWGILEVKCPYVLKDLHPLDIDKLTAVQRRSFCATLESGRLKLKKTHKYYSQVQMQMGVTDKRWCDFTIWSEKGISIERIVFDETFWNELSNVCMQCHLDYICPEYFENRIPRKLQPLKIE